MDKYYKLLNLNLKLEKAEEQAHNNLYDDFAFTNGSQARCESEIRTLKNYIKALQKNIEEDDYTLGWKQFNELHPDVPKEEYEMGVKKFQEV